MDFWRFIEANRQRPLEVNSAAVTIQAGLHRLNEVNLESFCEQFDQQMNDAYVRDLWGVAYLINRGCSDDAFADFRASLIVLGRDFYLRALENAESLLELDESEMKALFEEGLLSVGPKAYLAMFDIDPPNSPSYKAEPSGEDWEEEKESLISQFPQAWRSYGCEKEDAAQPTPNAGEKSWWKFW